MSTAPFPNRPRVDAHDKVMGRTKYAADVAVPNLLYAMQVPATIAKGRITAVDMKAALHVAGVLRVLTAADFPQPPQQAADGPPPPESITNEIAYRGQPVALVVAESLEAAIEGAEAVEVTYDAESFAALMESRGAQREPVEDIKAGDAKAAMAGAVTVHEAEYVSPAQHHNPIEMISTTANWEDGVLLIHEGTQGSNLIKGAVAQSLGVAASKVEVKSPSVGGSFGQKGGPQRQTAIVAHAAVLMGRPVKLVVPRGQIFHNAVFRPKSRHRIKLGADAAGRMIAIDYNADHQQSRGGKFGPDYHEHAVQMYGVADYLGTAANIRIDTQGPGYMRAPFEQPSSFALESAVDEMAIKLGRDPVAFRLAHDTKTDPLNGNLLSSRFLSECLVEGARRFGWERRTPAPGSMVLPDGTQIGWGVGCGAYPVKMHANVAMLRVGADGTTRFATAGHEMGQGIRSTIEQVLLRELAIDPAKLEILIGDTSVATQHGTGGSWGTASAVPVAFAAAQKLNAAMAELLDNRRIEGNLHRQLATVRRPSLQVEVKQLGPGQTEADAEGRDVSSFPSIGAEYPAFTSFSYVAHFVEVHIEPTTRRIRVPRVVSVADCGRVVSPRTAESQARGGVIWGIGAALREATEVDPRYGGWLNNDLADYAVAVNADIGAIEVAFIDRPDPLINALGAKGLGEVVLTGASGAVANAIFHATGKRLREMPFRIEHLL